MFLDDDSATHTEIPKCIRYLNSRDDKLDARKNGCITQLLLGRVQQQTFFMCAIFILCKHRSAQKDFYGTIDEGIGRRWVLWSESFLEQGEREYSTYSQLNTRLFYHYTIAERQESIVYHLYNMVFSTSVLAHLSCYFPFLSELS